MPGLIIHTMRGKTVQEGHDGHTLALFVACHMQVGFRHHSGGSENKRGDRRAWRGSRGP